MINFYRFRQMDGETVTLASDLVRDREWMTENSTGWTPWMKRAADDEGTFVVLPGETMGRVQLDFCTSVEHHRVREEGDDR